MGELIGLVAVVLIFGPGIVIPVVAMVQKHRRDMAQLELERSRHSSAEISKQIEALRQEIAELRRTSTEYDMSLQANLENLQHRVQSLEEELLRTSQRY
ncbi:MAG: hypothetical protein SNJ72_05740 [Fimbriimonadales bacterium]